MTIHRRSPFLLAFCVILLLGGLAFAEKKDVLSEETLARNPDVVEMRQKVQESPSDPALHIDMGNLYATKGWGDLAIQEYRTALKLDPGQYTAWANMGTVQNQSGSLDKAERSLRKAVAIQPRAALAHYNLGVVLEKQGRFEEALESYKTAVIYDPSLLDPSVNPQVVHNKHVRVVELMTYLEQEGASTLPLESATVSSPGEEVLEGNSEPVPVPVPEAEAVAEPKERKLLGTLIMQQPPEDSQAQAGEAGPSSDQ